MTKANQEPQLPQQPGSPLMEDLRPLADYHVAQRETQSVAGARLTEFQLGLVDDHQRSFDVDYAALQEDLRRKEAKKADATRTPLWRSAIDNLLKR